ncbi:solute carrier family 2, facilitated glucose transporter member 5-like [Euwallacea similis]|uniref:solute carrier family 2, facilitated glucose transporter member 5-like n=1 Tax=Euwallacea similis TaxID=1736056 RepID=UPI00344CC789
MEQRSESEVLFSGEESRIRPQQSSTPYRDISVEQPGWTKILVLAGIITVLGSSSPVGYNIGVINTPGWVIKQFCNESVTSRFNITLTSSQLDILWSSIVSVFLIGGSVGSLTGSLLADKIGRRGSLAISSVLGVIAGIMFGGSKGVNSIEMLFIGRIFGGLSAGLITTIMPMYLMELAPPRLKGAVGALCPLGVTVGILFGQILSVYRILGNETYWPHCLAISAVFQVICALIIPVLPESPKYLFVIKKNPPLALKQLKRIRNANEESLSDEIEILRLEDQENIKQGDTWNIRKVLKSKTLMLPLLLVCALQAGQQLSGVNAVFYYSSVIFKRAGLSTASSEMATIGAGCCNIFMAMLAVQTMLWFKRRTILLTSLVLTTLCLIVLGISIGFIDSFQWMPYLCILGVLGYVLCYGLGLGPIPYFIGSELFEVGPRSSAMALGSMANWTGNFIVGLTFPTMDTYLGATSFLIFAAIAVGLFIFVKVYLPETKGKDACEVYHLVEHGFKSRPLNTRVTVLENGGELSNLTEKSYL